MILQTYPSRHAEDPEDPKNPIEKLEPNLSLKEKILKFLKKYPVVCFTFILLPLILGSILIYKKNHPTSENFPATVIERGTALIVKGSRNSIQVYEKSRYYLIIKTARIRGETVFVNFDTWEKAKPGNTGTLTYTRGIVLEKEFQLQENYTSSENPKP